MVHVTYNSFSNKNIKTLFLASGYQEDIKILSRQSCIFQNGRCWGSMPCTAKSHLNYSEIVLICTSGTWEQKIVEDHLVSFSFRMLSLFQMTMSWSSQSCGGELLSSFSKAGKHGCFTHSLESLTWSGCCFPPTTLSPVHIFTHLSCLPSQMTSHLRPGILLSLLQNEGDFSPALGH